MNTFRITLKQLLLLLGDYAVFILSLLVTLTIRYGAVKSDSWSIHALPFSLLGVMWLVSFYIVGLYDLTLTRNSLKFFRTFLEAMIVNLAIALGFFYLIPIFGIAPRTNLLLYFGTALLLGYAWRLLFNRTIAPTLFHNRALFIGRPDDAAKTQNLIHSHVADLELAAVVETSQGPHFDLDSVAWSSKIDQIDRIIRELNIQTIILGHKPDEIPGLRDALYKTLFLSVSLIDKESLEETLTGRVPLEYVSQTWFLEHLHEGDKAWYESAKRFGDICLALPFGIVTLVLYPIIAALIKISAPGPALYSQIRVGKYGMPFRIWKFRTMYIDAEKEGPRFTADAKTDPRLFKLGRIFRQLRIDELPQIWNVLRGDLSFIGPRPERPEFVDQLVQRAPSYALRHLTRPGLTGWAQVRFLTPTASLEDNLKKLQYDLFYIKHRSPLLDLSILLRTIGIVLRRQGT